MESFLRNLFVPNEVILIAVYGQAFFVLGLAVALQWRSESRLELARAVPLLAAFGLLNAFAIWGDAFIPQQRELIHSADIGRLRLAQLLLMLVSFTLLLHFGMRLNWDGPWVPRLPWLIAVAGGLALIGAYLLGVPTELLRLRFEQLARPLIVLPGALIAAWGMRTSAQQIGAMGLPAHIVSWLRAAGISLGVYALVGGLFIPLTLDQVRLINMSIAGIPLAIPRLMAIATLAWAMIRALTIFRLELQRSMEEMSRLRALASDRQRIGRELHDGTIQAIYGAGLLLDNARRVMRASPDEAERFFTEGMAQLDRTIGDVRRYIFELSEGEGQLAEDLGALVTEMEPVGTRIEYRIEGQLPRYADEVRGHLIQMARESISNAIKHSGASEIVVTLRGEPNELALIVSDNGQGLPPGGAFRPGGRGIPNLRARASLLGGTLRLHNRPGSGLTVEVVVPLGSRPIPSIERVTPYEASTNPAR